MGFQKTVVPKEGGHGKDVEALEVKVMEQEGGQNQPKTIRCKYLVGADGVKSSIRQDLKIEMLGSKQL